MISTSPSQGASFPRYHEWGDVVFGEVGYCIVKGGWRWTGLERGRKINWLSKLSGTLTS
jgi:hypothetical protein